MERIRFENPALLHLLWLLLLQAILLWNYWRWRRRTLNSIGSSRLEQRLLLGFSVERFWFKNGVFSLVLLLIILAIANPQKMVREAPRILSKSDIIIAFDVSRSMLATDVEPNRLIKAQDYVKQLIKLQGHNRLGLVFFAGDAFPQSPLTNDPTALLLFLSNASPDAVNSQGTNFNAAILQALRLFSTDSTVGKAIVIVSDGESHTEADLEAAVLAKKEGVVIHTVSVGTVGGSTVPISSGRLLRDFDGNIVRTALQERSLERISNETNGYYSRIDDQNGIKRIERALDNLQKVHVEQQSIFVYFSYYQWLLFPAIVLLVIDQFLFWKQKTTF